MKTVQLLSAAATSLLVSAVAAGGAISASQTLVLDAVAPSAHTSGSAPDEVGHLQIARGILRAPTGRAVGGYGYTCRWIALLPGNDARERCSGWGSTAEGGLRFAGLTHLAASTHTFAITGGSRA